MKKYLLPAGLACLLAACGGGGNDNTAANPVEVDAFTALIQSQYMDQSETADPQPIEAVTVTTPETTEPVAL